MPSQGGRPLPYALDDVGAAERFTTSSASSFIAHASARTRRHTAADFQGRPLPFALDEHAASGRFSTTTATSFVAQDVALARPAIASNTNFEGRPLPYATDGDDASVLPHRQKANRFTAGRGVPYALDMDGTSFTTASLTDYVAHGGARTAAVAAAKRDADFDIVSLLDKRKWSNLQWRSAVDE